MKVFVVEVTDYYGYPISRTYILGIYSTLQLAEQALIESGAVNDDGHGWVYHDDSRLDESTAVIGEYPIDPPSYTAAVLR